MTQRQLATVLFKAIGVWCLVRFIYALSGVVALALDMGSDAEGIVLVQASLPVIAMGFAGALLVLMGDRLASALLPQPLPEAAATTPGPNLSEEPLTSVALAAMGIFVLLWYAPNALTDLLQTATSDKLSPLAQRPLWPIVLKLVLQVALATWLVLGRRGIVRAIKALQRD